VHFKEEQSETAYLCLGYIVVHLFIVCIGLFPVKGAWSLNHRYYNVKVFHFSYIYDPEVDKFQTSIIFFFVHTFICGRIFMKIHSVVFTQRC